MEENEPRFGNGGGICKTIEQTRELLNTAMTDIEVGTITKHERAGNSGNVYHDPLNSLGMPNRGIAYWRTHLPELCHEAEAAGKRIRFNIAGDSVEECVELAEEVASWKCDVTTVINFGCPNKVDGGKQHPIFSFRLDIVGKVLDRCESRLGKRKVEAKLSPYGNPHDRTEAIGLVLRHPATMGIVLCNTFPNGLDFEYVKGVWRTTIDPNNGFGGIGGELMLQIGLGHVYEAAKLNNAEDLDKEIIGIGGVIDGWSMRKYQYAGAHLVQFTTLLARSESKPRQTVDEFVHSYLETLKEAV